MQVKARFYVTEKNHRYTPNPGDVNCEIKFAAVYNNGKGNEDWSKWTPSGELKMTVTNPRAIEAFEIGKSYELTFTPLES